MPASGRKRKANFSNDETETLVWNVVRHFSALYGSEALRAHPVRRKQLWTQIQSRVNFLGYTERSIDDLKHKWRDLRLDVKKKITSKKHLPVNRAGGPLHKPRLTPLEKMVASTFLQASHDSEPEIILDPDLFFPGASKQPFMHLQPGVSHPSIYIDTNGQPSALPDVEGSAAPRLPGQSPDPAGGCEYRGEGQGGPAESGPELRTPEASAISPSLRNESLVSYASMSEEEEREGREVERGHGGAAGAQPGPEAPMSAEEDMKLSRQAMLIRRCSSQGSVTSLPEDSLNPADAHSDWGHEGVSDLPALGRGLDSAHPEEQAGGPGPEMGALPRVLMGPTWEKAPAEEEPPARSPLHGALTEESLPSSASPPGDGPAAAGPARGLGCSRLREDRRESWRTSIHHLLDLEEQWDQLYHQELAMWQEERATQREERARDRELQFRLLGVLTDIRDELRYLRQERAAARQSPAPPPPEPRRDPSPLLEQPKAEPGFPEPPPAGSAAWADTAVPSRSPFGTGGSRSATDTECPRPPRGTACGDAGGTRTDPRGKDRTDGRTEGAGGRRCPGGLGALRARPRGSEARQRPEVTPPCPRGTRVTARPGPTAPLQ
ncbi:protein PRRC2A-like [Melospiza georgiana]|uniref:protein PRRC2A-like n=1 Tax=Melospiza georgiana TaxID=44398 RepID=UPI0025AC4A29|nr:protein PRRC2A-like [Melospiza georgiana]